MLSIVLLDLLPSCQPILAAPDYDRNELLVKWKEGAASDAAVMGNAGLGCIVKRNFSAIGWQLVQLPKGMSVSDGIKVYQQLDSVTSVEANSPSQPSQTPSEATGLTQTGMLNSSRLHAANAALSNVPNDPQFRNQWALKLIGATNAWAKTTGSSNVVVAVIDTGVNYRHEDLSANMWRNPGETGLDAGGDDKATNGIDDDDNGYVDDLYGIDTGSQDSDPLDEGLDKDPNTSGLQAGYHGTSMAGIIGAAGNNGKGIVGVNWHVQIMAIKFLRNSFEETPPLSTYLEAFDYVIMMKRRGVNIRVINNSYGYWPSEA